MFGTLVSQHTAPHSHQIPDILVFEERLDNSLQRDLVKMEHVRMRIAHEALNSELIDMELIELKFIFDRCKSLLQLRTYTDLA